MTDLLKFNAEDCKKAIGKIKTEINWHWLPDMTDWVLQQALDIQQIPAPTFDERVRADYVIEQFNALDLQQVHSDSLGNAFGLLPGKIPGPGVMVIAHTDTVFSHQTDLTIKREPGRIYGPGLGDNSLGVAAMLGLAKTLQEQSFNPEMNVWFVATTREEGLGDLGGMRAAYEALSDQIKMVINLEGMAFGHIYHAGIAVRRLHITAHTEGGHSWAHFGRPSAVHAILKLGAKIADLDVPQTPRTTFNVGIVSGGQSINTIAAEAGLWLDLRSESAKLTTVLDERVRGFVRDMEEDGVDFTVEQVGDRPAGGIPAVHPLVQVSMRALDAVGTRSTLANGSTDGNIALADGCAAVTLGVTRGGNAHRLDEYIETEPIADGLKHLTMVLLAAVGYVPRTHISSKRQR